MITACFLAVGISTFVTLFIFAAVAMGNGCEWGERNTLNSRRKADSASQRVARMAIVL